MKGIGFIACALLVVGLSSAGCAEKRCENIADAFDDCDYQWDRGDFVDDCVKMYKEIKGCKEAVTDLDKCIGDSPKCEAFEDCESDMEDAVEECHLSPWNYQ